MIIKWKLIGNRGFITPINNATCLATYVDNTTEEFPMSSLPQYIQSMEIFRDETGNITYSHFPVKED